MLSLAVTHRHFWLCLALLLNVHHLARAITTEPLYMGTSLTLQGETYTWVSPATEADYLHTDTYTNSNNQTITVQGLITNADLANVTGSGPSGAISGYIYQGAYFDKTTTTSETGSWLIQGVNFSSRSYTSVKYIYLSDQIIGEDYTDIYTGPNGSYKEEYRSSSDSSSLSWSMYDLTTPHSSSSAITCFGYTYHFSNSSRTSAGNSYNWMDEYTATNGGTLKLSYNTASNQTTINVWDPNLGSQNSNSYTGIPDSSLSGVSWKAKTSPLFAKTQLWVNGLLLNFTSTTISTGGLITDQYSGAGINLAVSSYLHDYADLLLNANVVLSGNISTSGSYSRNGTFNVANQNIQNATPNRSAPFFTGTVTEIYYTASIPFIFSGGYMDSQNNRTDVFSHTSLGNITLTGNTNTPNAATAKMFRSTAIYSGTFSNNKFYIPGYNVIYAFSQPSVVNVPAYWLKGEFYPKSSAANTYTSATGGTLTLGGSVNFPTLSGNGFSNAPYPKDPGGIFILQDNNEQATIPALISNSDGSLHLSWTAPPAGLPPAVLVDSEPWSFLGVAAEDTAPGESAAYYGAAQGAQNTTALLKIRTGSSGTVTITDYSTAVSTTGSYNTATRLFQTSGPGSGFPMPVYAVDPMMNHALWRHTPDTGSGLPQSFVIEGQPWWYAGLDSSGNALYQGYYTGQQIRITPTTGVVSMTDPIGNSALSNPSAAVAGSFLAERRSIRLADGTVIVSGNDQGVTTPVTPEYDYQVHTIAADLDVVGNNLSFGVLPDDASIAGAVFHFSGDASTATLHSILSKSQARWGWWKAGATASAASSPVMWLDELHKLKLYPSSSATTPGIVLDPAGPSSFKNGLRVPPGGDISMGAYQEGTAP